MNFRFVDDEYVWNIPLQQAANSQFLQSWHWGVFQQALGRQVVRWQIVEGEYILAAAQCILMDLPFKKKYWYSPRGPIILTNEADALESILHQCLLAMRAMGKTQPTVLWRIEPMAPTTSEKSDFLANELAASGFKKNLTLQPNDEFAIKVSDADEELLVAMHEKTRYNVRLGLKHGVKARMIDLPDYARRMFPMFWELLQNTSERQHIKSYPKAYYQQLIDLLMPRGMIKLIVAERENEIITAHLLAVFGDTVYYLYGGSSYDHRQYMAPFVLHFEGMKLAARLGKTYYNFGGVSPKDEAEDLLAEMSAGDKAKTEVLVKEGHPWAKLTRFKEGFGELKKTGQRFTYSGGWDLVQSPFWYMLWGATTNGRKLLKRFR